MALIRRSDLWNSVSDIWSRILSCRFMVSLSSGTLKESQFIRYLRQDYLYLADFRKALVNVGFRSGKDQVFDLFVRHAANSIEVEREMQMKFLGSGVPALSDKSPLNMEYCQFIMYHSSVGTYPNALASVLACYWIYLEVGKVLQNRVRSDGLYHSWVSTYSPDSAYEDSVEEVLELCESLELGGPEYREFVKIFRQGCELELRFWESAMD